MEEEWKEIPGYEGYYEASSHGRIRSVERRLEDKAGRARTFPGVVMKPQVHYKGYMMV